MTGSFIASWARTLTPISSRSRASRPRSWMALPQTGASLDDGLAAVQAMVAIARSVESQGHVRLEDVSGGV